MRSPLLHARSEITTCQIVMRWEAFLRRRGILCSMWFLRGGWMKRTRTRCGMCNRNEALASCCAEQSPRRPNANVPIWNASCAEQNRQAKLRRETHSLCGVRYFRNSASRRPRSQCHSGDVCGGICACHSKKMHTSRRNLVRRSNST